MADVVRGNPALYFITGAVRVGVPAPWGCEKYCVNGSLAGNCCLAWGNDDCRNGTLARRVTAKVERLWQTPDHKLNRPVATVESAQTATNYITINE
jgi:hypothetical protein